MTGPTTSLPPMELRSGFAYVITGGADFPTQQRVLSQNINHKGPLCKGGSQQSAAMLTGGLLYYHFAESTNRQYIQSLRHGTAVTPPFAQGRLLWSVTYTGPFHLMPGRHIKFDGAHSEPSHVGAAQRGL